jgi:short-subunit dehydrogenase
MSRNKVVVITGASSGIGRATALRFAKQKADLVLASRRGDALGRLAEECEALGGRAIAVPTDTSDEAQVDALGKAAVNRFGRIDVWVNDAAISVFSPFLEMPSDDFRRVIDVNVMGYVYGAKAALRAMTTQGSGVLINVASIVGEIPQPYTAPYGMSKAAVRALGVSLRQELWIKGQKKIHVSTILPATIDTNFFQNSANYTGREVVAMPPVYPADKVAKAIVDAAKAPRDEVTVGAAGKALVLVHEGPSRCRWPCRSRRPTCRARTTSPTPRAPSTSPAAAPPAPRCPGAGTAAADSPSAGSSPGRRSPEPESRPGGCCAPPMRRCPRR